MIGFTAWSFDADWSQWFERIIEINMIIHNKNDIANDANSITFIMLQKEAISSKVIVQGEKLEY